MPPEVVGLAVEELIQFFFQFAPLDGVMSYDVAAHIPKRRFSAISLKS